MRMCREAEALTCREVTPIKGPRVTHVKVYAPELASRFRPGQYAWLLVPSVSPTSAHPFTANVIDTDHISFLCKDMTPTSALRKSQEGEGGNEMQQANWTRRLFDVAESTAAHGSLGNGVAAATATGGVTVVGFYGGVPASSFTNAPVVLVAGGIGITPVISVFQAALKANVQDVTLIWVIRNISYIDLPVISQLLEDFARGGHSSTVNVIVHVTRGDLEESSLPSWCMFDSKGSDESGGVPEGGKGGEASKNVPSGRRVLIKSGRPNMMHLFEEVVARNCTGGGRLKLLQHNF